MIVMPLDCYQHDNFFYYSKIFGDYQLSNMLNIYKKYIISNIYLECIWYTQFLGLFLEISNSKKMFPYVKYRRKILLDIMQLNHWKQSFSPTIPLEDVLWF